MPSRPALPPVALVTGAGSGVGRATALRFVAEGWRVALLGRREEPLRETMRLAPAATRRRLFPLVCDLGDSKGIRRAADAVVRRFHRIDALVNAAGHNIPRRSLAELSSSDYVAVMDANLNGVLTLVQAVLPAMRSAGAGTIVNIGSEAGRQASPEAGAASPVSRRPSTPRSDRTASARAASSPATSTPRSSRNARYSRPRRHAPACCRRRMLRSVSGSRFPCPRAPRWRKSSCAHPARSRTRERSRPVLPIRA